ncbi:MAG: hypothetical protein QM640_01095 [Niabella sp.]
MKQAMTFFTFLLFVAVNAFSQDDKYTAAMKTQLGLFKTAESADSLNNISAAFERIGNAEKTQWVPYYYAALAKIKSGYADKKADKDAVAKTAAGLIEKGEAVQKNSEFYTLRYMNAILQMIVDPMQRFMTFGQQAEEAYSAGIALDANNPRLYYLKGRTVANTPEQFGGGRDAAKEYFQKAVDAAKHFKVSDPLGPTWGGEEAQKELDAK